MPLGTNNLYAHRGRIRFMVPKARENKAALQREARASYQMQPLEGALKVHIDLRWPTRRNHDVDNIKILLDALTGILWVDDGQITDLRVTKAYDKENPGALLTVETIES